jgi:hypothetical protein
VHRSDLLMKWAGVESPDGKVLADVATRMFFGIMWSVRASLKTIRQALTRRVAEHNPPT